MSFYVGRYLNRERLEFDCEVVTPMFLAGADGKTPEIRAASIKGVLRFWWRALYGSDGYQQMLKDENSIFGGIGKGEGKSKVKVRVKESYNNKSSANFNYNFLIKYLAYGYKNKDGLIRQHIVPKTKFTILLEMYDLTDVQKEQVKKAMLAFLTFGGLGSRSRNGLGSLHHSNKIKIDDLKQGEKKHFISFSRFTDINTTFSKKNSWKDALIQIGERYKNARNMLKNNNKDRALVCTPFKTNHDRYAKSFFMHVNKTPDNKFQAQILYLPTRYKDAGKHEEYKEVNDALWQYLKGADQ